MEGHNRQRVASIRDMTNLNRFILRLIEVLNFHLSGHACPQKCCMYVDVENLDYRRHFVRKFLAKRVAQYWTWLREQYTDSFLVWLLIEPLDVEIVHGHNIYMFLVLLEAQSVFRRETADLPDYLLDGEDNPYYELDLPPSEFCTRWADSREVFRFYLSKIGVSKWSDYANGFDQSFLDWCLNHTSE